jgi:hypothetical protein
LSVASGRCIGCFVSSVTSQTHGRVAAQSSARSAPVKAATTPSASLALETSTLVMRAWAKGLRTTAAKTMPGRVRSST